MKKVLIIDGDAEFVRASQALFESNSIRVARASSPAEGLLLAESELPDAIMLEVMLPEATEGFHFAWDLRQHEDSRLRDVPILFVSRLHQTVPFRLTLLEGDWEYAPGEFLPAQGFIDKPVEPEVLLERVRGVLGLG